MPWGIVGEREGNLRLEMQAELLPCEGPDYYKTGKGGKSGKSSDDQKGREGDFEP